MNSMSCCRPSKNPNLPEGAKDFAAAFVRATNWARRRERAGTIFPGHRWLLPGGGMVQSDLSASAQIAITFALTVECGASSE
jgi:hypothetical protein